MNWTALIFAIILNSLACGFIFMAQGAGRMPLGGMPCRLSIIPGTDQPFLYWQDFYCQRIGCLFGLPLVLTGYIHLIAINAITPRQILCSIVIAGVGAIAFTLMCLGENHKPDSGFPATGQISWAGKLHLVYWSFMVSVGVVCIWSINSGTLRGLMMWLTIVGAAIYVTSWKCDVIAGHFAPVRYTTDEYRKG